MDACGSVIVASCHCAAITIRTDVYAWSKKSIAFHRCTLCGCVTHWAPLT